MNAICTANVALFKVTFVSHNSSLHGSKITALVVKEENEFMLQDVLLMIIREETKTKVQTENSWNTQNDEYSRVRTSTICVLSGF